MSRCYNLICDEAGMFLWVGQGRSVEEPGITIYSSGEHVDRLVAFLSATRGKHLRLCDSEYSTQDIAENGMLDFETGRTPEWARDGRCTRAGRDDGPCSCGVDARRNMLDPPIPPAEAGKEEPCK